MGGNIGESIARGNEEIGDLKACISERVGLQAGVYKERVVV